MSYKVYFVHAIQYLKTMVWQIIQYLILLQFILIIFSSINHILVITISMLLLPLLLSLSLVQPSHYFEVGFQIYSKIVQTTTGEHLFQHNFQKVFVNTPKVVSFLNNFASSNSIQDYKIFLKVSISQIHSSNLVISVSSYFCNEQKTCKDIQIRIGLLYWDPIVVRDISGGTLQDYYLFNSNGKTTYFTTIVETLNANSHLFCFLQVLAGHPVSPIIHEFQLTFDCKKGNSSDIIEVQYEANMYSYVVLSYIVVNQNQMQVKWLKMQSTNWNKDLVSSYIKQGSRYQLMIAAYNYLYFSKGWPAEIYNYTEILTSDYFSIRYIFIDIKTTTLDIRLGQINYNSFYNHIEVELYFYDINIQLSNLTSPIINNSNYKVYSFTKKNNTCFTILEYEKDGNQSIILQFQKFYLNQESPPFLAAIQIRVLIPYRIDVSNHLKFILEVLYGIVFLVCLVLDVGAGVNLVLFIQLVFLGQNSISSTLFFKRLASNSLHLFGYLVYSPVHENHERLAETLKLNSYWMLTIVIPLLISIPFLIMSKRLRDSYSRLKSYQYFRLVLIQWTYAFIMINLYYVIACLVFSLKEFGNLEAVYLSTQLLFVVSSFIFQPISRYYWRQRTFFAGTHNGQYRFNTISNLNLLANIAELYLLPVFLSVFSSATLTFSTALSLLLLLLVYEIFRRGENVSKASKIKRIKMILEKALLITTFIIYVCAEVVGSKNIASQYFVYDLVSYSTIVILAVNLASTLVYLSHVVKLRKEKGPHSQLAKVVMPVQQSFDSDAQMMKASESSNEKLFGSLQRMIA